MPRVLKAVRLDDSDAQIHAEACDADEWVTTGGFAVCDLAQGLHRAAACRCASSFLSLTRDARTTLAEVVEVTEADVALFRDQMRQHLVLHWKAPDADARETADAEIDYTLDLASSFPAEVWISVRRTVNAEGLIDEQYNQYERLLIGAHPPPA
ncbi:MAG: hypothetical protein JNK75_03490 [Betaproteobacteria bacterium]|nr:hypothetical protein [Betaproteobacteria bacterium]